MLIIRSFIMLILLLTGLLRTAHALNSETQGMPTTGPQTARDNAEYVGSTLLNIPLQWKPTEKISDLDAIDLTAFQHVTFTIRPFNDVRKKPSEIGKNIEKRTPATILYVTTRDNVAAWLADRFGKVLSEFDLAVVNEGGTMSLEADIVRFYVTEESVYTANVGLKIRLRSKSGDMLWQGLIAVSSNRWGRSYQAENYHEALSNAFIDVTYNLLKNDSFQQAVKKGR